MAMHARYESRCMEEYVLLAAARVDAEERAARFMNEYERHAEDGKQAILQSHAGIFFRPIPSGL